MASDLGQPANGGRWLAAAWVGFAFVGALACSESNRRPLEPNNTTEEASTPPDVPVPASLSAAVDHLARALCDRVTNTPRGWLEDRETDPLGALQPPLTPAQREELASEDIVGRAAALCPDVLPSASLTSSRRLPVPAGPWAQIPGLYDASHPGDADEERARYEWTAVGLGCAGLWEGTDHDARDLESQWLGLMGYDLDSYIAASLAMDDPAMSDRIFTAILGCARRARADVLE